MTAAYEGYADKLVKSPYWKHNPCLTDIHGKTVAMHAAECNTLGDLSYITENDDGTIAYCSWYHDPTLKCKVLGKTVAMYSIDEEGDIDEFIKLQCRIWLHDPSL